MDYLSLIKEPISSELEEFIAMFNESLEHEDGLLAQALNHIRQRGGKRMRPMLILLITKAFGSVTSVAQHAAIGLELLHTASLVHDDVVDESGERRGQASVNAVYDNKVSVLVGDYILSTALLQLSNIRNEAISEEVYYDIIKGKTAALFEACAAIGAQAAGATPEQVAAASKFGQNLGIIFQIRDDIFDYYDAKEIGKPTGNDMVEGKLTLPAIYAVNNSELPSIKALALKVKNGTVNADEIAVLVDYTKTHGGIEYAERRMWEFHAEAQQFIDTMITDESIKCALQAYLDYVIERTI